ncbi:N-acetyltransferase family protein [Deinococcus sp.]|uniref:GNAT family N-acetyltransferase n=1 Tax=Deinococcus sp. TaxID=47478 RepID=UPI003C7ACA0D
MTIRPLRADDEAVIRDWLRTFLRQHQAWWAAGYGEPPVAELAELVERDWQELEQAAASPQRLVAILEVENQAVGIVQAGVRQDRTLGFQIGVLQWIYVSPEVRRQGMADKLMVCALAWMDAQGVQGREVFVTVRNPPAVALYRRHGFEVADYRMLARAGGP